MVVYSLNLIYIYFIYIYFYKNKKITKSKAVWYLKIFTALSHQPLLRQQYVLVAESENINSKGQKINYIECKFSVTAQMWVGLLMQSVYNCI